jgi:AraC-like DNA-binding protein
MCLFLPANNLLSCEHASTPFSETIIRIPEPALRMASRGEVNFERLPWRFDVAPVSSVYGIAKAFINLVLSENPPPLLIEAMSVAVKVSVVCGLAPQETRAQVVSTQGLTHIRRRRVQEYIEQNIGRQITVEEMARVAAMSTHHFNRSFKVSMGVSPARYLWTRRVEKAKRLLSNTHTPIAAVAMACGFRSQSHFTTSFKQVTQVTPAAWRKAKN